MTARPMELQIVSFQNVGQRDYQEDAYYISDDSRLFVVCDGVGGSTKGALASKSVIDVIAESYRHFKGKRAKWIPEKAVRKAEQALRDKVVEEPTLDGMATTIALLYLESASRFVVLHVGDSRVYSYDHMVELLWCSKDHSIVQELYDQGILTSQEEMRSHPLKNRITKAITASESDGAPVELTISRLNYNACGGRFLLCSDGVIEQLSDADLQGYVAHQQFATGIADLDRHCQLTSKDNNTCIALKYW